MALLEALKHHLRLEGTTDADTELQRLVDAAVHEFFQFATGAVPDPLDEAALAALPPDAVNGILLMAQSGWERDPEKRPQYRRAAELCWAPHRNNLGV